MFDRMMGEVVDTLQSFDLEIPSYEDLIEEFTRTATEIKHASEMWLYDVIFKIDGYAEELEAYIFENEELVRAITGKIHFMHCFQCYHQKLF